MVLSRLARFSIRVASVSSIWSPSLVLPVPMLPPRRGDTCVLVCRIEFCVVWRRILWRCRERAKSGNSFVRICWHRSIRSFAEASRSCRLAGYIWIILLLFPSTRLICSPRASRSSCRDEAVISEDCKVCLCAAPRLLLNCADVDGAEARAKLRASARGRGGGSCGSLIS